MEFDNIGYLEDIDFSGKKLNLDGNIMVMIWASWCPHCVSAHPEYQEFADEMSKNKNILVTCIQADGVRESEKNLGKDLKNKIDGFQGFPTFVFYKNGNLVDTLEGERVKKNFMKFAKKNM